ncbi:hypothetical protein Ciccas_007695 [Cichlidogyrus casuarinus]|uniref:Uncharacterized protein n=1 Tax=Cichlidogyrus casuarinus TaxID=1844966 RepID=A0ABD2Q4T2_9PLAT
MQTSLHKCQAMLATMPSTHNQQTQCSFLADHKEKIRSIVERELKKEFEEKLTTVKAKCETSLDKLKRSLELARKEVSKEKALVATKEERMEEFVSEQNRQAQSLLKEISSLKGRNAHLELKLEKYSQNADALRTHLSECKKELAEKNKVAKLELSNRLTDLTAELDRKWAETVSRECAKMRENTQRKMLAEFESMKEQNLSEKEDEKDEIQNANLLTGLRELLQTCESMRIRQKSIIKNFNE